MRSRSNSAALLLVCFAFLLEFPVIGETTDGAPFLSLINWPSALVWLAGITLVYRKFVPFSDEVE